MEKLREQMLSRQIVARGVKDERVIEAMRKVERHKFVADADISDAYADFPLPIGHGQTISQPYIVALMTELCEMNGTEKVLEIGTGSGYQTAILSLLAKEVYSIEVIEPLGKAAAKRLSEMGYNNIHTRIGDGYSGWIEEAPFDIIILTACPDEIPDELISQLKTGGVMIAPVGYYQQKLVRISKTESGLETEDITYVRFVPMVHS